jgi:hypothetical protein
MLDSEMKLVLQPVKPIGSDHGQFNIMKEYMLSMGRQLNGIKEDAG